MSQIFDSQRRLSKLSISLNKAILLVVLFVIIYFGYNRYQQHYIEKAEAEILVLNPQVSDIYFLDMRLINDKYVRKNKYKLAKVIRISDENVAIVYGKFSYQWQYSVVNSIQYGELSNDDYFTQIPDYFSLSQIKEMKNNGAIYLIKRPVKNKLYGNFVRP